jgi:predicted TPR repeat methyltransferase
MSAAAARSAGGASRDEAERLLEDGATAQAVEILKAIVAREPRNVDAKILLARCAIAAREPLQALALLDSVRGNANSRQRLKIRLLQGWIFFRQRLDAKADAEFAAVAARRNDGLDRKLVGDALFGIARLLLRRGDGEAGFAKLEEALHYAPRHRALLLAYADALADRKEHARALASLKLGVADGCIDAEILNHAGVVLRKLGMLAEATRMYEVAMRLMPGEITIAENLAIALCDQGRHDEAARLFAEILRQDPGHATARHMSAALSGGTAPARASNAFVAATFDSFADNFDEKLVQQLGYRVPSIIGEALAPLAGATDATLDVVDLGCGTGLCGPILRPFAKRLVGVDLSERMLAKARTRGLYDELHQAEITSFLVHAPAAADLIVAGDVLIYFGALDAVFAAINTALRDSGRFAFTVERHDTAEGGWRLGRTGRYAHNGNYLRTLAATHGFAIEMLETTILRREGGEPVPGYIAVLQRT